MNILKFILGAIIDFLASLMCPTFDCSQEQLDKMKIVKGRLPAPVCTYKPDMPDDIILDEDFSLYGACGIPQKK